MLHYAVSMARLVGINHLLAASGAAQIIVLTRHTDTHIPCAESREQRTGPGRADTLCYSNNILMIVVILFFEM